MSLPILDTKSNRYRLLTDWRLFFIVVSEIQSNKNGHNDLANQSRKLNQIRYCYVFHSITPLNSV